MSRRVLLALWIAATATTITACSRSKIAPEVTAATTTALERAEPAALLDRPWRMVAYGPVGGEEPVSGNYTNTLTFVLDTNGQGTVSTQGCVRETYSVRFDDDNSFSVGDHVGMSSACADPFDEGQHVDAVLVEGTRVRWSVGDDGRLTLTSTATADTAAVYE